MDGESSSRSSWTFSGGKRVSQFNPDNPIGPVLNEFYTLFFRDNYMKIYENYFGSACTENDLTMDFGLPVLYFMKTGFL